MVLSHFQTNTHKALFQPFIDDKSIQNVYLQHHSITLTSYINQFILSNSFSYFPKTILIFDFLSFFSFLSSANLHLVCTFLDDSNNFWDAVSGAYRK